ncbi:MAG: hypothetical protein JW820_12460 [Spirochaetales bacterium]|nr:hypothetical protein [Spirochaetales bacterium]
MKRLSSGVPWLRALLSAVLLGLSVPVWPQAPWRQFVISDVVGSVGAGASSQLVENEDWGKYAPRKLFDGSKDSAWVEGVDGDGVGEQVWFTVDPGTVELTVTNGFARTNSLFRKNGRVRRLEASLWEAATAGIMVTELGRIYQARPASGLHALSLADSAAPQSVVLPLDWAAVPEDTDRLIEEYRRDFEVPEGEDCRAEYLLCLEIREVYPGTTYQDTCIAEISWTLPPELAGPGGRRAGDLVGTWRAESGSEWECLRLEIQCGVQLFEVHREGSLYDAGLWYVGDGQLALASDAGPSWIYTDGSLEGGSLVLIREDGHRESYVRESE